MFVFRHFRGEAIKELPKQHMKILGRALSFVTGSCEQTASAGAEIFKRNFEIVLNLTMVPLVSTLIRVSCSSHPYF